MTRYQRALCSILLTVLWYAIPVIGADQTNSPTPISGPDGQWTLHSDYSDEFNQRQLNTNKWDTDGGNWGFWSWEPENVWVKSGSLHLRIQHKMRTRGEQRLSYMSGIIRSKSKPIKYGYFEARIKAAPRFPGVCPAFWLYRVDDGTWTEIDIIELTEVPGNVKRIDTNLHVFQHPKLFDGKKRQPGNHHAERRHWDAPWDPRDDFHVYGCEWDEGCIRWYIDGNLVNEAENRYWHQPLDVVLSFGLRHPLEKEPSDQGFPTVCEIDYVRVWKKEAPNKQDAGDGK